MSAKVLCLGIDAASPDLLRRWSEEGLLPVFRSLLDRGVSGDLPGITGFFVGSTWPSLYTGTSPADHGFHYLFQLSPGSYEFFAPGDHGVSRQPPFWRHLSDAGRRVAVLDVPLSSLDPSLNGIQTVEWGGHDSVYGFRAMPPRAAETIRDRFGPHPLGPSCDGVRRTPEDYEHFLAPLLQGVRTKSDLTRHFLREGGWDLFMQVFTEAHCAGHQCWHLHDPAHPAHDPDMAKALGDPLLRVYQAIDTALGEILEAAGDGLVLVFTAHGMSFRFGAHFLLPEILFRLGVAGRPRRSGRPGSSGPSGFPGRSGIRWMFRRLPEPVRNLLSPLRELGRTGSTRKLPLLEVDLATSQCFPIPNGLAVSGIRLNMKGREPQGVLDSTEVDDFCSSLTRDLMAIRERRTGRPLVKEVHRTADLYQGQHLEALPDLLVEWDDRVPLGSTALGDGTGATVRAHSEKTGVVEGINDYGRSGEHRPNGMFVAAGPGLDRVVLEREVSLLDLAPTITQALGVELPNSEGNAIQEILAGLGNRA